ncbi:MAG TPA: class F sortase [Marmoricola sp.]|nr:class F sortase [Marmoricola sp.]
MLATGAAGAAAVRVASSAEAGSSAAGPGVLATDQRAAQGPRPVSPSVSAAPRYLTSTYHAPRHLIDVGGGGTLQIPSIGVTAPVDSVGLDGTTMALPDDPARVGWLDTTAPAGGPDGSSVLAGHVSDEHDDPGALWSLRDITVGAHAIWTDAAGVPHVFVVTAMAHYPRATGLPAATFGATGPHVLRLVTCADRLTTAGGGFHYADNLVVTAVEASARTG